MDRDFSADQCERADRNIFEGDGEREDVGLVGEQGRITDTDMAISRVPGVTVVANEKQRLTRTSLATGLW